MFTVDATRITVTVTEHTGEIPQGRAVEIARCYAKDHNLGTNYELVSAHWNSHRWNVILHRDSAQPGRPGDTA